MQFIMHIITAWQVNELSMNIVLVSHNAAWSTDIPNYLHIVTLWLLKKLKHFCHIVSFFKIHIPCDPNANVGGLTQPQMSRS